MAVIRNEAFSCFVFYGVLLVIKMYVIAIVTGQVRLRKKVSGSDLGPKRWKQRNLCTAELSLMQTFFLFPERLLQTRRTRWDTEVYSITERIHMWRDAGGKRVSHCQDMLLFCRNTFKVITVKTKSTISTFFDYIHSV